MEMTIGYGMIQQAGRAEQAMATEDMEVLHEKNRIHCTGLLFCLGVSVVRADVTVETVVKSDSFKGMGASEGTTVSRIQGLKWVETKSMKFTGAIFSFMPGAGEKKTITIDTLPASIFEIPSGYVRR